MHDEASVTTVIVSVVRLVVATALTVGVGGVAVVGGDVCGDARTVVGQGAPIHVNYGFYTDFNPLSYAATQDAAAAAFNEPLGYEPALVAAVGIFSRGRWRFDARGIGNLFAGVWLRAVGDDYDIVGGGITSLPARTRDADGDEVIRFGAGHVRFRQSLLVNADNKIDRHADLDGGHTVGVLRGTTGEARLLALTGITDADGDLAAGTLVTLADGTTLTAGADKYKITASSSTDAIAARVELTPPRADSPAVRYYDFEAAQLDALRAREIDAVARGEIGNAVAAVASGGAFTVTALDPAGEHGAFAYAATPAGDTLREKMNAVIQCLTADGTVGINEWLASDGAVFAERAAALR